MTNDFLDPPQRRAVTPPTASPPTDISLLLLLAVTVTGLYVAREVLIPIALAVLLSFLLAPLVGLLRRIGLGRSLSVLSGMVLAIGIILILGGIIATQIAGLAQEIPTYSPTIEHKIDVLRRASIGRVDTLISRLGRQLAGEAAQKQSHDQSPGAAAQDKAMPVVLREPNPTPLELANRYLSPALSPFTTLGIVIVVTIFILLQQEDLRDRLIRLIGSGDLHGTTVALDDGARRLSRYFLSQLAVNLGFGIIIGCGLFIIGVPRPVLWGIASALLRFIPYIGSFISAVFPVALAAAVDPGWTTLISTIGLYLVVELLVAQGLEPLLYGRNTGLSPVAVLTSAVFWSWIWGPVGLFLSMPLALCLVVIGRHVKRLEFLDVMLGDRPALTPVEGFYQRILAGDVDEAREQAENLLKEMSLSGYYDEVALKGLRLAAVDAQRGVLYGEQLLEVRNAVRDLIQDFEAYEDQAPSATDSGNRTLGPPEPDPKPMLEGARPARLQKDPANGINKGWRSGDSAVLCLAGRGPLDDAAGAMLVQLLRKHGVGARLLPHEAVSRHQIGSLGLRDVAMICILYLELRGGPAHLRYLLERLLPRLPKIPVLVGLWPSDDTFMDPTQRKDLGATYCVTSLREAVDVCLREAASSRTAVASSF